MELFVSNIFHAGFESNFSPYYCISKCMRLITWILQRTTTSNPMNEKNEHKWGKMLRCAGTTVHRSRHWFSHAIWRTNVFQHFGHIFFLRPFLHDYWKQFFFLFISIGFNTMSQATCGIFFFILLLILLTFNLGVCVCVCEMLVLTITR